MVGFSNTPTFGVPNSSNERKIALKNFSTRFCIGTSSASQQKKTTDCNSRCRCSSLISRGEQHFFHHLDRIIPHLFHSLEPVDHQRSRPSIPEPWKNHFPLDAGRWQPYSLYPRAHVTSQNPLAAGILNSASHFYSSFDSTPHLVAR